MSREEKPEQKSDRVLIRSKRRWVLNTIELDEESPGPFPLIVTELFNDKQEEHSVRFRISGHGVTKEPVGALRIHERSGIVYMYKPIDREKYPIFHVSAVRRADMQELVNPLTEHCPSMFSPQTLTVQVPENIKGLLPLSLKASDRDEQGNVNSLMSMKIKSQEPSWPIISLTTNTSVNYNMITQLAFRGCFDYDKIKSYTIKVVVTDHGDPPLSSTGTVNIDVTDSNTHAPVFTAPEFNATIMELESNKEILRLPVQDSDTPNTVGISKNSVHENISVHEDIHEISKTVFTILKGNEEGNYKIETDLQTNEGVLTVIKGKAYERTTVNTLEIKVENEEPLFLCIDGQPFSPIPEAMTRRSRAKVNVTVVDLNDPPDFQENVHALYRFEDEKAGNVLYVPVITDEDSDTANVRCELVQDPAKWMSIDPVTCKVTLATEMDCESTYVINNTYTVVMQTVDDGKPPATGKGTLVVRLSDVNDNKPHLTSNTSLMCGNKVDRVLVTATDADAFPFSGPFTFTLDTEDQELKSQWKFDPSTGEETSLISLTSLPYRTYSVPLTIADQQGLLRRSILQVVVCKCGKGNVCQELSQSYNLHIAAIGTILGVFLLMALLLCFCFVCECRQKISQSVPFDGIQTLIKYNDEGGGSSFKADQMSTGKLNDNIYDMILEQLSEVSNGFRRTTDMRDNFRTAWARTSRNNACDNTWNGSNITLENIIKEKITKLSMEQHNIPEDRPRDYSSEGTNINNLSLENLSICSTGDNLDFLQNLGQNFITLDKICQEALKEKNIKL